MEPKDILKLLRKKLAALILNNAPSAVWNACQNEIIRVEQKRLEFHLVKKHKIPLFTD